MIFKKEIVKNQLNKIPSEIIDGIKPLSNKDSWVLLLFLINENKPRTRKQITEALEVTLIDLDSVLNPMIAAGLVCQKSKLYDIGDKTKSIYEATLWSKQIVENLLQACLPNWKQ